jgi:hypothetical protein
LKQPAIEITNEQVGQELDMGFKNEECEVLARETGFIQHSTSRLIGSGFLNLLTVEALDEPTISYEGLCDILEERDANAQITPQALCERMNSDGAVEFLVCSEKFARQFAGDEERDCFGTFGGSFASCRHYTGRKRPDLATRKGTWRLVRFSYHRH